MRPRLSYANVMSTLCFFLLLGGGAAYAASQLAKNSVGSKQLKKNSVTTAKIKNEAVTAGKIKKGSLTGTQINASTLGSVPNANSAQTAQTAQTANGLSAPEPWRVVGASGEPPFLGSWIQAPEAPVVAFYKDHEGVVHFKGVARNGSESAVFQLPPGFRPAANTTSQFPVGCEGTVQCTNGLGTAGIIGSGAGKFEGDVFAPSGANIVKLEGVTFRAES